MNKRTSENKDDTHCSKRGRKSEDEVPQVSWADLPSIAVENIYSYLNREDQCRMACVCRNWNREFGSPNLWRKFKFLIPKEDLNLEVYPEVRFARQYGQWFHHVEILCNSFVERSHEELIWKQITLFFEALTFQSQLNTFKFLHENVVMLWLLYIDDATCDDVHQTIKKFFLSQHHLKNVEIRNAALKKSEEAEILRVIFHKNSKSLENVCLVNDVYLGYCRIFDDYQITENVGNEAIFESFLNIKTLQLNYTHFFETIMMNFYEYIQNSDSRRTKGNLELIEIFCDHSETDIDYRGIPPECWKLFTKIFPSLRINLTLHFHDENDDLLALQIDEEEHQIRGRINLFVVPSMPLKVLNIKLLWSDYNYNSETEITEIGVLFRCLQSCRTTHEYLEELSIVWPKNMNILDVDLIRFLQTFQKLRILDISTDEPSESLHSVFIPCWIENQPPSFRTLFVSDRNVRMTRED